MMRIGGLYRFNGLSIQLSECERGERGNPKKNGATLCAEKYFSSEHHEGDSLSFLLSTSHISQLLRAENATRSPQREHEVSF